MYDDVTARAGRHQETSDSNRRTVREIREDRALMARITRQGERQHRMPA